MVACPNAVGQYLHPYIVVAVFEKFRPFCKILVRLKVFKDLLPLVLAPAVVQQIRFNEVHIQKSRKLCGILPHGIMFLCKGCCLFLRLFVRIITVDAKALVCFGVIDGSAVVCKTVFLHRTGNISLHGLFKKTVTPETEWIEAIGILLDNAIEASPKGSTIFLSSKKQGDFLELTVSNPAPPLSNTEFMALFGKGVTTKASRDGHGFGLYNILRMTERYHGKILTRNESILNENYVVFGILMP